MLFDISLIGDTKNLYLKRFGRSNLNGVPHYLKFDFSAMSFVKLNNKLSIKSTGCKSDLDYGFYLVFEDNKFFINNKTHLSKKEIFYMLSYLFDKIYDKNVKYPRDSLHAKIKKTIEFLNKIYNFTKEKDHKFNMHAQYRNVFVGCLSIDYRENLAQNFV
ncbi:MAG: hypothetical protein J6M14_04230 [Campylobacter sp.]|uniref:hypothetical protein n=1 Tax=Campylobacter sp. JMF_04 NA10 TaxID=2983824 RepID=UPI001B67929F|nr:hypothetical protein [Campylobacter sp. JMF_04 NA10]MBP3224498.1 hypothetical protein [Campylobacter sp.]MDA3076439.1 hypothetical protein [Campylobacter sp. JMF_04 NA10]